MKLFVTDLDGTLLNSSHEISAENRAALELARSKGLEIAIATGRTYADAYAICQTAGLSAHIISNNGSFVYTKDGAKLKATALDRKFIEPSLRWLDANGYYYDISTDTTIYLSPNTETVLKMDFSKARDANPSLDPAALDKMLNLIYSQKSIRIIEDIETIIAKDMDYFSILGLSFDPDKLIKGRTYFGNHDGLNTMVSGRYNFEMISSQASKGIALEYLANHLDIPISKTIAIGDNHNDLSMLETAGIGVAMGNAEAAIRERCRYVSKTNEEHGVAHIIHELKHLF